MQELHPSPATSDAPLEWTFACQDVPEPVFLDVAAKMTAALDGAGLPWAFMGGLASAVHGRPRWTYDLDVFVQPHDAHPALAALARAGFGTDEKDPMWIFKAMDRGVLVDIIFRATAGIYFDEEMIERVQHHDFRGLSVPVLSPEDVIVIKATAFAEHSARHWWDALGMLARADLDWEYLVRRSSHSPGRVASLLFFARSIDLAIPARVIASLIDTIRR